MSALVVDPVVSGVVYAGTSGGGVFASRDGGDTWQLTAPGLMVGEVNDLALEPGKQGALYAATDNGVYRLDAGATGWQRMSTGLPAGATVSRLAVDPVTPSTLYATVEMRFFTGPWGVFRSTDRGERWRNVSRQIEFFQPLAIAPSSPPTVYATDSLGVVLSTDGGLSWSRSNEGLPQVPRSRDLAVDPNSPATVYLSIGGFVPPEPLFKSVDGGLHWSAASQGLENAQGLDRLAVDAAHPGTLYLAGEPGIFRSTDGGASWSPADAPPADRRIRTLAVDFADGTVYAGPGGLEGEQVPLGVLRSRDGGASWQPLARGLTAAPITGLLPDPRVPRRWVVGTEDGGVRRSEDGGVTWAPADSGLEGRWVGEIARDPFTPETLYAITGANPNERSRVDRSTDGGATWRPLSPDFGCCLNELAADPGTPGTVYAAGPDKIFRTVDGGATWTETGGSPCPGTTVLALPPGASKPLLLGCTRDSGAPISPASLINEIFRLGEDGATWERVFTGPSLSGYGAWTLAFDPFDSDDILAGLAGFFGGRGLFRSRDGGITWSEAGLAEEGIQTLLFDPLHRDVLFAGTVASGVLRSTDGGATWKPFNLGLGSADVRELAIAPAAPSTLLAGTPGGLFTVDLPVLDPCTPTPTTLCLGGGRFRAEVEWQDFDGGTGVGRSRPLTDASGFFWFFHPDNLELLVKVLDGRTLNGHFWVFFGSLTNVAFEVRVTDTETGAVRTYSNPRGTFGSRADVAAF